MKAHVGVDAISGLVHTAGVTSGNVHDAKVMDRLIRDDDAAVYGDKGYASGAKKRAAEAAGVLSAVKEKAKPGGRLTARQRARNHRFGKVRAKVEHAVHTWHIASVVAVQYYDGSWRKSGSCSIRCQ